jgi:hypothetical protein
MPTFPVRVVLAVTAAIVVSAHYPIRTSQILYRLQADVRTIPSPKVSEETFVASANLRQYARSLTLPGNSQNVKARAAGQAWVAGLRG